MNIIDIAIKLIFLPKNFHELKNVSIYNLLKETGYFEKHQQISGKSIHEALVKHPECIDDWLLYSADKRTSSGWYFLKNDDDSYTVGYFKEGSGETRRINYADKVTACAAFIKNEVEEIRKKED